eukprot:15452180-Alexandrium_andersonii.AAC.2
MADQVKPRRGKSDPSKLRAGRASRTESSEEQGQARTGNKHRALQGSWVCVMTAEALRHNGVEAERQVGEEAQAHRIHTETPDKEAWSPNVTQAREARRCGET